MNLTVCVFLETGGFRTLGRGDYSGSFFIYLFILSTRLPRSISLKADRTHESRQMDWTYLPMTVNGDQAQSPPRPKKRKKRSQ